MTDEFILRICLAGLVSGIIGVERQIRGKGAGLRTHVLIGMGSALFMIVSKYGFADVLALDHVGLDPSRIAAQVVTGVGFIGAGNIIVRNQNISGLTTAADIWVTASIGMVIGSGMYELGVYGSIMTLLVLEVLHQITSRFMNKTWHLQLTLADIETASIIAWFKNHHIKSRIVSLQETATNDIMTVDITLTARTSIDDIMQELKNIPGVQSVSIS